SRSPPALPLLHSIPTRRSSDLPCAACEQTVQAPEALPPPAPLPIISRRGRPREVDTSQHFCPHPTCAYRGWVGLGNLSANGHPRSEEHTSELLSPDHLVCRLLL